jgi:hypothetical protein
MLEKFVRNLDFRLLGREHKNICWGTIKKNTEYGLQESRFLF